MVIRLPCSSTGYLRETTALDGVGYEALVKAEIKLLIQLSKAIARELK